MLQRPGENQPWQPTHRPPNSQQHDDPNADQLRVNNGRNMSVATVQYMELKYALPES